MQTYQSTPDFYREYIEHGWLSDAASKTHKYLDKYMSKAGKWVYVYGRKAKSDVKKRLKGIKSWDKTSWLGRDGTAAHKPGLGKKKKQAWEQAEAIGTTRSKKNYGKYISSYSGRAGAKKIQTKSHIPTAAEVRRNKLEIRKAERAEEERKRKAAAERKRKQKEAKRLQNQRSAYLERTRGIRY